MSYNWINAKDYTMNSFLLLDRWALQWIFTDCNGYDWFPAGDRDITSLIWQRHFIDIRMLPGMCVTKRLNVSRSLMRYSRSPSGTGQRRR